MHAFIGSLGGEGPRGTYQHYYDKICLGNGVQTQRTSVRRSSVGQVGKTWRTYIHTSHYILTFRNITYHMYIYVARYLFFSFVCMYVCNCMKYTLNIVTAIIFIHTFIRLDMWNLREWCWRACLRMTSSTTDHCQSRYIHTYIHTYIVLV